MQFGPGVPGRESLGAQRLEDFLGTGDGLEGEDRLEVLFESTTRSVLRYPLPGTPRADGRLSGPPRGAGTGWVRLVRYRGAGLREALGARFQRPRSESLAARDWNLMCRLRASGVGTPEPLAVGGDARASFLVTRELTDVERLSDWLAIDRGAEQRRLGLAALGALLGRVLCSGVLLPQLAGDDVFLGRPEEPCSDAEQPVADRRIRRLPPVFLGEVCGGRFEDVPSVRVAAERLFQLYETLVRVKPKSEPSARECYSVFVRALRGMCDKSARRSSWRRIVEKHSRSSHRAAERANPGYA